MWRTASGAASASPPQLAWSSPVPNIALPPRPWTPAATVASVTVVATVAPPRRPPSTMAPFRLGITTDVQYAAKPPMVHPHPPPAAAAAAAAGTRPPLVRDYAAALPRLAVALSSVRGGAGVDAVVHLGDLIDGHEGDVAASVMDLDAVLAVFDEACGGKKEADGGSGGADRPVPVLHAVGNHCLTAGRAAVMRSRAFWGEEAVGEGVAAVVAAAGGSLRWGDDALPAAPAGAVAMAAVNGYDPPPSPSPARVGYYEFTPPGNTGWRLLFLDTMHLSVAYPAGDARRAAGEAALSAVSAAGSACAKEWNGAVGGEQLRWLEERLSAAAADGVQVLVCGHHPLVREAAVRLSLGGVASGMGGWVVWGWNGGTPLSVTCPCCLLQRPAGRRGRGVEGPGVGLCSFCFPLYGHVFFRFFPVSSSFCQLISCLFSSLGASCTWPWWCLVTPAALLRRAGGGGRGAVLKAPGMGRRRRCGGAGPPRGCGPRVLLRPLSPGTWGETKREVGLLLLGRVSKSPPHSGVQLVFLLLRRVRSHTRTLFPSSSRDVSAQAADLLRHRAAAFPSPPGARFHKCSPPLDLSTPPLLFDAFPSSPTGRLCVAKKRHPPPYLHSHPRRPHP